MRMVAATVFTESTTRPSLMTSLRDAMGEMEANERYSLADDQWSAMAAGSSSAIDYLNLAEGYSDEDDLDVWDPANA